MYVFRVLFANSLVHALIIIMRENMNVLLPCTIRILVSGFSVGVQWAGQFPKTTASVVLIYLTIERYLTRNGFHPLLLVAHSLDRPPACHPLVK